MNTYLQFLWKLHLFLIYNSTEETLIECLLNVRIVNSIALTKLCSPFSRRLEGFASSYELERWLQLNMHNRRLNCIITWQLSLSIFWISEVTSLWGFGATCLFVPSSYLKFVRVIRIAGRSVGCSVGRQARPTFVRSILDGAEEWKGEGGQVEAANLCHGLAL